MYNRSAVSGHTAYWDRAPGPIWLDMYRDEVFLNGGHGMVPKDDLAGKDGCGRTGTALHGSAGERVCGEVI